MEEVRKVPNELDGVALVILNRSDCEKIPEGSSVLLVIQEPSTVTFSILDSISDFGNLFLVCVRPLQKPAAMGFKINIKLSSSWG